MSAEDTIQLAAEVRETIARDGPASITRESLDNLMTAVISIFDDGGFGHCFEHQERAIAVAAELACYHPRALTLLIENAEDWGARMHCGDSYPTRNSYEALARVSTSANATILPFLERVIAADHGIPAWAATQALHSLKAKVNGGYVHSASGS